MNRRLEAARQRLEQIVVGRTTAPTSCTCSKCTRPELVVAGVRSTDMPVEMLVENARCRSLADGALWLSGPIGNWIPAIFLLPAPETAGTQIWPQLFYIDSQQLAPKSGRPYIISAMRVTSDEEREEVAALLPPEMLADGPDSCLQCPHLGREYHIRKGCCIAASCIAASEPHLDEIVPSGARPDWCPMRRRPGPVVRSSQTMTLTDEIVEIHRSFPGGPYRHKEEK